jgi:two-component system sensor histidine kinase YesM
MTREKNTYTEQMVGQISNDVDFYIKDMSNIINTLGRDPRVYKFMTEQANGSDNKLIDDDAYEAILGISSLYPEIAGVMAVNSNDNYVSDVMTRINKDPLTQETWYREAVQKPGNIQLFSKPIGRNIYNIFQYSADSVVSISEAITVPYTNDCLGVILIDMKLDSIKNVIQNIKPGETGFIYIVDSKGEVVYAPVNPVVYRIKNEWFENEDQGIDTKDIKGINYELINKGSTYTGWKTIGVFPVNESLKPITYMRYLSYMVAFLIFILASVLALVFSRAIANPISKLRGLMKNAEEGDFSVRFNSKYQDEIGQLGNSFNNMIKRIKDLIDVVQNEEKAKRKAEIEILQAQIKPHFLYNTLDTIQWMAREHEADNIVEIVESLTNLLRIGLNKGGGIIELEQEIKHVESYLIIQKIRYEDKLNYRIEVDENIMKYNVIKLILQPLVENAIYHGIKEKRGSGMIVITGKEEEGKIHIQVSDNGIGMTEEKLNEINTLLKGSDSKNNKIGYGILNVNDKIMLNFGNEYGLHFSSTYGVGTVVDIWHPIMGNQNA